jgi:hypothetical protein
MCHKLDEQHVVTRRKKPTNEHVDDMSQARTTIGSEGMEELIKKHVDDMS